MIVEEEDDEHKFSGMSAEDIFYKLIQPEIITMDELMSMGVFDAAKIRRIRELTELEYKEEHKLWFEVANKATVEAYENYLEKYPQGKYTQMAAAIIKTLRQENAGNSTNHTILDNKTNSIMTDEEKQAVLSNIPNISAQDLYYLYIKPGHITLEQMMETGTLEAGKRRGIQEFIDYDNKKEDELWNEANARASIESYEHYIKEYPKGRYLQMAEAIIRTLRQKDANESKRKDEIMNQLRISPNGLFTPKIINDQISNGDITIADLRSANIPDDIINKLSAFRQPALSLGEIPTEIPAGFTEVYFWGIPGSGKTCALAGVLSQAQELGMLDQGPKSGPGYHYTTQLKNIFRQNIGFLPSATATETTQCLPFELKDERGKMHPITLMELSGEIFQCYYYKMAGLKFPSDSHVKTFNTVTRFLRSPNRKVHFFVFDLSKKDSTPDGRGLCQDDYLNAAQNYFKANDIFKNYTDAIYIVGTKSDALGEDAGKWEDLGEAQLKKYYPAFVNVLKDACNTYRINDNSKLKFIPFSLGDVYFNHICKFNSASSNDIIKILQQKTGMTQRKNILAELLKK